MATTPNFGWVTPAPTDFVTDLPADFETFADAVDADVQLIKNTADAALPETLIDAAGDLIYGSAADTAARLAIGTAGQVLTVNSGATAPEWATPPAAGGDSWTLVNSGGTALTGASTITVSGISSQNKIMILVYNASSANASAYMDLRINGDSGNNYYSYGMKTVAQSSYGNNVFGSVRDHAVGVIPFGTQTGSASGTLSGYCKITGADTANNKMYQVSAGGNDGANGHIGVSHGGRWDNSASVTSVSIISGSGNFDNGTIWVYVA